MTGFLVGLFVGVVVVGALVVSIVWQETRGC